MFEISRRESNSSWSTLSSRTKGTLWSYVVIPEFVKQISGIHAINPYELPLARNCLPGPGPASGVTSTINILFLILLVRKLLPERYHA